MLTFLADFTGLTQAQFLICVAAVFGAGMVRGFAGFALSAILMASIVVILPPVELIPLCFLMEAAASVAMFRGGVKAADMSVVWVLSIGSILGVPLGLWATTSIPVDTSRIIALFVVLGLTLMQLFKLVPAWVGTRPGLYGAGLFAGLATGLASVGGMVVALYVLSRNDEAAKMRGSLVMYLLVTLVTSLIFLLLYEVMNLAALQRGLVFAPVVLAGVSAGSLLFRPSLTVFYKRFCLVLLMALSFAGLAQMI